MRDLINIGGELLELEECLIEVRGIEELVSFLEELECLVHEEGIEFMGNGVSIFNNGGDSFWGIAGDGGY